MKSTNAVPPQDFKKKSLNIPKPLGCCAGQALGCGCSFLASWVVGLLLSALVASVLGPTQGANPLADTLLPGAIFAGSLILAAVLSFLTGRFFPVFQKKAG